jgi:3'-5' exonuclease
MLQHQTLFVFDIETIPDTEAAPALTGIESQGTQERRQALETYHLEATEGRNAFLRQPFHQVVCISFLEAQIARENGRERYTLTELRSGGTVTSTEKELLQGFFRYLERHKPRLISFNGRTFDLPVLKYRAMVHGVSAPWLHLGGDKWSNYTSRYSVDWHCDLLEALSDFGASARVKLNEVCAAFGLPGKMGIDGAQVAPMVDDGKIAEIRQYCETDVLNTYLVYLRWQQHRGVLLEDDYQQAIADLLAFLQQNGTEKPHFRSFLEEWHLSSKGKFAGFS